MEQRAWASMSEGTGVPVLTLATRMFVINEKLFLFAIVDRYPFATCAKDIFVFNQLPDFI